MEAWPPTELGIPDEAHPSSLSDVLKCLRDQQLNKTGDEPTSVTLVPRLSTTNAFSKTPTPPYGIMFTRGARLAEPPSRQLIHELRHYQVPNVLRAIHQGHWPWTKIINTAHALYNIGRISAYEFEKLSQLYDVCTDRLGWVLAEKQKREGSQVDVERELLSSLVLATILIDQAVRCIPEDERAKAGPMLKELDLAVPLQMFKTSTLTLDFEVTGYSGKSNSSYLAVQLYFPAVHKPSQEVQELENIVEGLHL